MRTLVLLNAAALVLAFAASPANAQIDPCAGSLDPSRMVDCLKPDGLRPVTRGIRPAQPGTAARTGAAAPRETPPPPSSVSLTVPFGFNSAELTSQGTAALDALAVALKDPALAGARFRIAGHTDAKGSDAYNQSLSERRAEAALHYLVDRAGIDPARLSAVGFGRTQLYDPANPTAAANRRVQVIRVDN